MEKCRGFSINISHSKKLRLSLVFLCLLGLNLLPVTESYARSYGFAAAKQVPMAAITKVFYDGALNTGLPATQNFSYISNLGTSVQSFANGVTTLDTTSNISDHAGYFGSGVPILDPTTGFSIRFTVQLISETHNSTDRAGFSIIVLDNNVKGIELGFWTNQIWAQNDPSTGGIFTHGEGKVFNTTSRLTPYDLTFLGNNYYLSSNGVALLSGTIRDYSSNLFYQTPNYLFLGDDTTSAQAVINFSYAATGPITTFTVNQANDSGNVNTMGSLSWALNQTQAESGNTINFAPNLTTVTRPPGSLPLPPLKAGVSIQGSCAAPVTLDGGGLSGDGLSLQGNNKLTGLTVTHFGGRQIVATGGSKNNTFTCVVAKR